MTLECGSRAAAFGAGDIFSSGGAASQCLAPAVFVIPSEARNLLFYVAPR
jgi:hypothetical protein